MFVLTDSSLTMPQSGASRLFKVFVYLQGAHSISNSVVFPIICNEHMIPGTTFSIFSALTHSRLTPSFFRCSQGLTDKISIINEKANGTLIILGEKMIQSVG